MSSFNDEIREITLTVPDDFHHHLRDGEFLKDTVYHASNQFSRVVCVAFKSMSYFKQLCTF